MVKKARNYNRKLFWLLLTQVSIILNRLKIVIVDFAPFYVHLYSTTGLVAISSFPDQSWGNS